MPVTDIGIDLGSSNVVVYARGKGIVIREPSVAAYDKDADKILAFGEEAKGLIDRTQGNIVAVRPLRAGVISDYSVTEKLLRHFIQKAIGRRAFRKPFVSICVPSGVTEVEKRAAREAATQAGGKDVFLMEEPLAAAIGAGLDVARPEGNMVMDIGGGTTDIAIIALGGIVTSMSVKVAGDKFDEAIIKYMRKKHKLYIGERTAEELKINIGTAFPRSEEVTMTCSGRDLVTGLPRDVEMTSSEMLEALEEPLHQICEAAHAVLEKAPPELAADISSSGIYVTGGGALMYGIDQRVKERTGIDVHIADEPMNCVAVGTGKALDNIDVIQRASINRKRRSFI